MFEVKGGVANTFNFRGGVFYLESVILDGFEDVDPDVELLRLWIALGCIQKQKDAESEALAAMNERGVLWLARVR